MKKTLITCLAIFAASGITAQAQTLPVTLDEAIRIALDENPTVKIADLEIERQTYVRRETIGNLLPAVDVSGTYNHAIKKSDMGGGISFDPSNTVTATASLTLPLFAPGVYRTLKLNDEQMRAALEDARANKINLVNEVRKAYYNILLAQQSLDVLYSSRSTVSETVEDTRTKFQAGLASEYDLITAEVQLSNIIPNIIQTENSIGVAVKWLKMLMSVPEHVDIVTVGDLGDFADIIDQDSLYLDTDLTYNTDLTSMDIQVDILRRQLEVLKTQRMPTLGAFLNYNPTGRDPLSLNLGGADLGGGSDKFFWAHPVSAGLQINIPIFAGNKRINQEKQLRNNITQLRVQREYLEDNINVQITTAINDIITAREMMLANLKTVGQAQKGYDISRTRYNAGMGTILEVNTAELALTQAKLNYTQSIYDYLSAQADYEKIKGQEF